MWPSGPWGLPRAAPGKLLTSSPSGPQFPQGKNGILSLVLPVAQLVQATSRLLRDSTTGGAVLIPQWAVASSRKQGLGLSKLAPPCSLHPPAMQGAHQLSLHQPFIFRFEFDFNHYLADSISSPWMKGPRGEEEGKQCSLPVMRGGLLLCPSCSTKKWGPRNIQRAYPNRTSIL